MRFGDLKTGDVVTAAGIRSVVLAIEKPHPQNPAFHLIVWWIFDQKRLSMDMLDPNYEMFEDAHVHHDGLVSWRQAMREACRA
jgi:hypothetical protein